MAENSQPKRSFEESLEELQRVVNELQAGDVPLEKTVELYKHGVGLRRECEDRLRDAERLIETLSRDEQGRPVAENYEDEPVPSPDVETGFSDDDVPF